MLCPGFPGGSEVKVSAWNAGDPGSIPGLGSSWFHGFCLGPHLSSLTYQEEPGQCAC